MNQHKKRRKNEKQFIGELRLLMEKYGIKIVSREVAWAETYPSFIGKKILVSISESLNN